MRDGIQYFKRDRGFQVCRGPGERFELVVGGHHRCIPVDLAFFAFLIHPNLWEKARPMKVERGIEMLLIEGIDTRSPALGNMGMAKQLPHHRPILTFDQGVIVGLAGAGLVNSIKSLLRRRATRPLMYSEPLSE